MGMPLWLQHTLVLVLVAGCLWFVGRDAVRALGNRASKLAGCGSCKGCATEPARKPADTSAAKPAPVVFLPADALTARLAQRRQN